jgi:hypothetical protein
VLVGAKTVKWPVPLRADVRLAATRSDVSVDRDGVLDASAVMVDRSDGPVRLG